MQTRKGRSQQSLMRVIARVSCLLVLVAMVAGGLVRPTAARWDGGAGTGPGGVGATDGTGTTESGNTLELWLRGDAGVYTDTSCTAGNEAGDGEAVACWADQSGRGNDVSQATSTERPSYSTGLSEYNSLSALTYDGTNDSLTVTQNDQNQFTIFIVADADNTSLVEYTSLFGTAQDPGTGGSFQLDIGGSNRGCSGNYRFHGQDDTNYVVACLDSYSTSPDLLTYQTAASGSDTVVSTYQDGAFQANVTLDNTTPLFEAYKIGINRSSSTPWDGNIAEEILYYGSLNTAERILVENHLSAKYDIALDASAEIVYADYDSAYTLDVAGVGRESDGTNLEAHSAGLVLTDSDTNGFLNDNGDYVVVGHSEPDFGISTSNLPTGVNERWSRDWYLDRIEAGSNHSDRMTLAFDFSEAGGTGSPDSADAENYYLLVRGAPDQDFDIVSTVENKRVSGDQILFDVGTSCLSDGHYYTLGADTEPLNVSLSEFEAAWQKHSVAVDWTTTLEVGTVGFHVWRSPAADGDYVKVSGALIPSVDPGANTGGSYHFEDARVAPGATYFYKLEEVETGGATNWYGPVSTADGDTPTSVQVTQASAVGAATWLPALGLILGLGAFLWVRTRRR